MNDLHVACLSRLSDFRAVFGHSDWLSIKLTRRGQRDVFSGHLTRRLTLTFGNRLINPKFIGIHTPNKLTLPRTTVAGVLNQAWPSENSFLNPDAFQISWTTHFPIRPDVSASTEFVSLGGLIFLLFVLELRHEIQEQTCFVQA